MSDQEQRYVKEHEVVPVFVRDVSPPVEELSLFDIWNLFARHARLWFVTFIAVLIAGIGGYFVSSFIRTPQYTLSAVIWPATAQFGVGGLRTISNIVSVQYETLQVLHKIQNKVSHPLPVHIAAIIPSADKNFRKKADQYASYYPYLQVSMTGRRSDVTAFQVLVAQLSKQSQEVLLPHQRAWEVLSRHKLASDRAIITDLKNTPAAAASPDYVAQLMQLQNGIESLTYALDNIHPGRVGFLQIQNVKSLSFSVWCALSVMLALLVATMSVLLVEFARKARQLRHDQVAS